MEPILVVFDPGLNKLTTLYGDDARAVREIVRKAHDRFITLGHGCAGYYAGQFYPRPATDDASPTIGQRALEATGPEDFGNKGIGADALQRLHPEGGRHCTLGVGPTVKELPGQNLYIRSANGKSWKLGADDNGNLVTEEVDENIPA